MSISNLRASLLHLDAQGRERTGLRALDSASRLVADLADDAVAQNAACRAERRRVPRRPSVRCFDSQASNGVFAHIPTHLR
jgi:hypothetical protein